MPRMLRAESNDALFPQCRSKDCEVNPPNVVMEKASYSPYPLGRKAPVAILGVWALIDFVVVASGGSHFYFNLIFTVGLACASYVFLWLLVGELSLSGEFILWRTPVRSGRVRTVDVNAIHPGKRFSHGMATIETVNRDHIRVMGGSRFRAFCAACQMRRPELSAGTGSSRSGSR